MHRRRFLATLAAVPFAVVAASRVAPAAVAVDIGQWTPDQVAFFNGIPRDVWAMQARVNFLESQRFDALVAHPTMRFVYPRYLGTIRSLPS